MASPQDATPGNAAAPPAAGRGRGGGAPRRGSRAARCPCSATASRTRQINGQRTVGSLREHRCRPDAATTDRMPHSAVAAKTAGGAHHLALRGRFRGAIFAAAPRIPPYTHLAFFHTEAGLDTVEGTPASGSFSSMAAIIREEPEARPSTVIPGRTGKATPWSWIPSASTTSRGLMDRATRTQKASPFVKNFHDADFGNLAIDVTIDDPGTFTRPWHMTESRPSSRTWRWRMRIFQRKQSGPRASGTAHDPGSAIPRTPIPTKHSRTGIYQTG